MTKSLRLFAIPLACAASFAAASIPSQDLSLHLDPAQTKVEFTLGDVLHTVHGTFQLKRGDIRFNPKTGAASGELVVDAASGASGSAARDRRMHANILESGVYPDIVFRPDRIEGEIAPEGRSHAQIHGKFLIHGGEHEITVPAEVEAAGGRFSAIVTFDVPYVQWGMKNPSTLFLRVSDRVAITVRTVAVAPPQS